MKPQNLIIIVTCVILVLLAFYLTNSNNKDFKDCKSMPAKEMNIGEHQNLVLHIHPNLKIVVKGVQQEIPGNIGLLPAIMRPIHTHDNSGYLHVESPCLREFSLGDFFKIWGENFNSTCIFEHCTNEGELKIYVNGVENNEFENLILRDADLIEIIYE